MSLIMGRRALLMLPEDRAKVRYKKRQAERLAIERARVNGNGPRGVPPTMYPLSNVGRGRPPPGPAKKKNGVSASSNRTTEETRSSSSNSSDGSESAEEVASGTVTLHSRRSVPAVDHKSDADDGDAEFSPPPSVSVRKRHRVCYSSDEGELRETEARRRSSQREQTETAKSGDMRNERSRAVKRPTVYEEANSLWHSDARQEGKASAYKFDVNSHIQDHTPAKMQLPSGFSPVNNFDQQFSGNLMLRRHLNDSQQQQQSFERSEIGSKIDEQNNLVKTDNAVTSTGGMDRGRVESAQKPIITHVCKSTKLMVDRACSPIHYCGDVDRGCDPISECDRLSSEHTDGSAIVLEDDSDDRKELEEEPPSFAEVYSGRSRSPDDITADDGNPQSSERRFRRSHGMERSGAVRDFNYAVFTVDTLQELARRLCGLPPDHYISKEAIVMQLQRAGMASEEDSYQSVRDRWLAGLTPPMREDLEEELLRQEALEAGLAPESLRCVQNTIELPDPVSPPPPSLSPIPSNVLARLSSKYRSVDRLTMRLLQELFTSDELRLAGRSLNAARSVDVGRLSHIYSRLKLAFGREVLELKYESQEKWTRDLVIPALIGQI